MKTVDELMALADDLAQAHYNLGNGPEHYDSERCDEARAALLTALQEVVQPVSRPLTDDQIDAIKTCRLAGRVSVSMIQRLFAISYTQAENLCQSIIDAGQCDGLEISPHLHGIGARLEGGV